MEGIVHRLQQHIVGKQRLAVRHAGVYALAHGLAHGGAGHLASIVSAHAIAQDEEAVGIGLLAMQGVYAVFLVRVALRIFALSKLLYAICF